MRLLLVWFGLISKYMRTKSYFMSLDQNLLKRFEKIFTIMLIFQNLVGLIWEGLQNIYLNLKTRVN